jgi:hypothetical protein
MALELKCRKSPKNTCRQGAMIGGPELWPITGDVGTIRQSSEYLPDSGALIIRRVELPHQPASLNPGRFVASCFRSRHGNSCSIKTRSIVVHPADQEHLADRRGPPVFLIDFRALRYDALARAAPQRGAKRPRATRY